MGLILKKEELGSEDDFDIIERSDTPEDLPRAEYDLIAGESAEDIAARKLFAMRVPLPFVEKMEAAWRYRGDRCCRSGSVFLVQGKGRKGIQEARKEGRFCQEGCPQWRRKR